MELIATELGQPTKCPNNFPVHQLGHFVAREKVGHFVAREKVGHFVVWDNLSAWKMPVGHWFSYGYTGDIAKNCPRYIQDNPEICASFSQGMGIQIDKVGQNVAGESASVGTLCRQGVERCSGTFCRWDTLSPKQTNKQNQQKNQ